MSFKKLSFLFVISSFCFGLIGCEDDEANKINQAQICLNNTTDANYQDAAECADFLKGINTQQAKIVSCSIEFKAGGLTNTRVANAIKKMDDEDLGENEQKAFFMGTLSLDDTESAERVYSECLASEVEGFIYMASLARSGTYLLDFDGLDPDNLEQGDLDGPISDCVDNPDGSGCNIGAIGESVVTLSDSYCTEDSDEDICEDIDTSVANGASNEEVGKQLLCEFSDDPRPSGC